MTNAKTISVEVVYALPTQQTLLTLTLPEGSTLLQAVQASGILQRYPEIDMASAVFGVFSKIEKAPESRVLQAGDRVEIYRPLLIDPKEARRARAEKAKKERK